MQASHVDKAIDFRRRAKTPIGRKLGTLAIRLLGADIPQEIEIGEGTSFAHNGLGTVITPYATIGKNVRIYQNVTLGLANPFDNNDVRIIVEDGACICAGAKVLVKPGETLTIGANSIIGANAVVNHSIPAGEVWAGIPAHRIGTPPPTEESALQNA